MRSCSKTCLELKPDFDKVQSLMQTNQRELAAQLYFHAVMPLCPPLLRLWLTQDFPDKILMVWTFAFMNVILKPAVV